LEEDHNAVLGMIEKCTRIAKQFYNEIEEEEIKGDGDSNDDDLQESYHNDNPATKSATESEDTSINQVTI
jgi:hypothetical protein